MQKSKELVIFIPNLSAWKYVMKWPNIVWVNEKDKYWDIVEKTNQYVLNELKRYPLSGVYFGNEFCEQLIPSLNDILECYRRCYEQKMRFTLVTPLVSNKGIQQLENIFQSLDQLNISIEIVFNDWGVAKLLAERYPEWPKRVGRTLDKMIREPRLNHDDYTKLNAQVLEFMQEPAALSESYTAILSQLNIQGLELDCIPQGYGNAESLYANTIIQKSIYLPFYCVTSGRLCMMKALGKKPEDKWNIDESCVFACQKYNQVMQKFTMKNGKQEKIKLLRKGNAVFGYNTDTEIWNMKVWDRLVWQPQIPI